MLRNNYYFNAWVIYGSAGGLRTGHLRICGWSTDGSCTDLRVVYGRVIYGFAGGLRIYGWVSDGLRVIPAAAMEYQLGS